MGVGNVVVELTLVIEPHALLLVGEGDLDAEFAPPHLLHGLEQPLVEFQGGKLDFQLRKSVAAGITRLREQLPGGGEIVRDRRAGGVAGSAGRRQTVRGLLAAKRHVAHQRVAVDRAGERLAHAPVGEGCPPDIEAQEGGVEERVDPQDGRVIPAVGGDL